MPEQSRILALAASFNPENPMRVPRLPRPSVAAPALAAALLAAVLPAATVSGVASTQEGRPPETPDRPAPETPAPETFVESETKVEFLSRVPTPRAEGEELELVGVAVREKTVFKVNVYAYGIYVEPYGAQAALEETWGETDAKKLKKSDPFFADVLEGEFTKSLRMVFVRKVDGEDVQKAFRKDLGPRIERRVAALELPDESEAFATFQTFFEVEKLTKGAELVLTWHADGRVSSRVLGEDQVDLQAPALGWAIFDLFLGDRPLEPAKRRKLVSRFPTVLDLDLPPRPEPPPADEAPSEGR